MDRKLSELMRAGAHAEARVRLDRLLAKRDALATENYVRYCVGEANANGFDLTQGDVALIHPKDLPQTVHLVRGPVYAVAHPEVIEGKMLFIRKKLAEKYLTASKAVH